MQSKDEKNYENDEKNYGNEENNSGNDENNYENVENNYENDENNYENDEIKHGNVEHDENMMEILSIIFAGFPCLGGRELRPPEEAALAASRLSMLLDRGKMRELRPMTGALRGSELPKL